MRARALADKATLDGSAGATDSMEQADEALAIAREVDDPALLVRALTACGGIAVYNPEVARPYFAEALGLARSLGDGWRLSQILAGRHSAAVMAGDPIAARAAGEEGRDLADAIGDRFASRRCRWCLGGAQGSRATWWSRRTVPRPGREADALRRALDGSAPPTCGLHAGVPGDPSAARAAANAAIEGRGGAWRGLRGRRLPALAVAALAEGDVAAADARAGRAGRIWVASPR